MGKLTTTFLWQMEKLLGLYAQPYDPNRPLWCFDERPCQLIGDTLVPLPVEPGNPKRQDYQDERHGVCSVLLAVQPHTGLVFGQVRERRTALDYAEFMAALVAAHCPEEGQIVLIQDNLNTHTPAAFYQAFEPQDAYELMQRIEMHYTPKKASWLNMAEIQLSVLVRQCLKRRIPSFIDLAHQVHAWARQRHLSPIPIRWQFTPEMARIKFQRFYPNLAKL